jgi:hypothetical protein
MTFATPTKLGFERSQLFEQPAIGQYWEVQVVEPPEWAAGIPVSCVMVL